MKKFIIIMLLFPLLAVAKDKKKSEIVISNCTVENIHASSTIEARFDVYIAKKAAKVRSVIELRPFLYSGDKVISLEPLYIFSGSAELKEKQNMTSKKYKSKYATRLKARNGQEYNYLSQVPYVGNEDNFSVVVEKWGIGCRDKIAFLGYIIINEDVVDWNIRKSFETNSRSF
ncbi:MAG: hypothetical protein RR363_00690 [Rikenellaceae bacterium]